MAAKRTKIKVKKQRKGAAGKRPPLLKRIAWGEIGRYSVIILGACIQGLGQSLFLIPAHLAPGGLNGIGIIINDATGGFLGVGTLYAIMNVPFFIWALKLLGPRYLARTAIAIIVSSAVIDLSTRFLFPVLAPYLPQGKDLFLASFFGGAMIGIGVGLVFRNGGSLGGTDIISQLIHWLTGFEFGKSVLILDSTVILIVTAYFKNIQLALYSVVALLAYAYVIDIVQSGMTATKLVMIITTKYQQVMDMILEKLGRGATILDATGGYTEQQRKMLLCAAPQSQLGRLKEFVRDIDPKSFVMVLNLSEVVGKGFERKLPK